MYRTLSALGMFLIDIVKNTSAAEPHQTNARTSFPSTRHVWMYVRSFSIWIFILTISREPSKKKALKAWSKKRGRTTERATPIFCEENNCFSRSLCWIPPLLIALGYVRTYVHLSMTTFGITVSIRRFDLILWQGVSPHFDAYCVFMHLTDSPLYMCKCSRQMVGQRRSQDCGNQHTLLPAFCISSGWKPQPSTFLFSCFLVFCSGLQYTLGHNRYI